MTRAHDEGTVFFSGNPYTCGTVSGPNGHNPKPFKTDYLRWKQYRRDCRGAFGNATSDIRDTVKRSMGK